MKESFSWFLVLLMLFLVDTPPAAANPAKKFYYEPSLSTLYGCVELQKFTSQAPPYYELKDNPPKVDVPVFIPDRLIDVIKTQQIGPDEDSFYGVAVVEVDFPGADKLKQYIGRHVKIVGYLSERTTGFEYTDVLLTVESINLEPR